MYITTEKSSIDTKISQVFFVLYITPRSIQNIVLAIFQILSTVSINVEKRFYARPRFSQNLCEHAEHAA